jgi:hypothetical protein
MFLKDWNVTDNFDSDVQFLHTLQWATNTSFLPQEDSTIARRWLHAEHVSKVS